LVWQLFKNKKSLIEIIILILIIIFLIWARFVEINYLKIKNYNFEQNKNYSKTLKVVVFSDLHLGVYNNSLVVEKLVTKINNLEPDLVIIPGDFVYFIDEKEIENNFKALKDIRAIKVAVLGNHDYSKKGTHFSRNLSSVLESLGILMIDNKTKIVSINDSLVELIGVEDIWVGNPDYSILKKDNSSAEIDFRFFITHNPDSLYEIKDFSADEYKKIDLMISGHTHAGQIRIPFLYKYIIPTKHNFDKGFYKIADIDLFITPGIGTVGLPLRLFNFPEISVLDIKY
jgi:hypothetical protein